MIPEMVAIVCVAIFAFLFLVSWISALAKEVRDLKEKMK